MSAPQVTDATREVYRLAKHHDVLPPSDCVSNGDLAADP